MLQNVFAAVRREQQIVMFLDDIRDMRKWYLKVVINDIRSGLLTSLVCKVSLQEISAALYLLSDEVTVVTTFEEVYSKLSGASIKRFVGGTNAS